MGTKTENKLVGINVKLMVFKGMWLDDGSKTTQVSSNLIEENKHMG